MTSTSVLWVVLAVVLVLWLLGLLAGFGGSFINLLLVVAAVLLVAQYLSETRR